MRRESAVEGRIAKPNSRRGLRPAVTGHRSIPKTATGLSRLFLTEVAIFAPPVFPVFAPSNAGLPTLATRGLNATVLNTKRTE